jgi:hypothetical protein
MDDLARREKAWGVLAQVWVDTSYDEKQLDDFASQLVATGFSPAELRRIAYWDVCGAFALFTLAVFGSAGMTMPDWYYPEELAREKVAKWTARPAVISLLNPFWLVGYPISLWFMRATMGSVLSKLEQRP